MGTCPRCGYENNPGARFCRNCGGQLDRAEPEKKPVPPAGAVCPRCGTEASPGAKFCRSCGAALSEAETGMSEKTEEDRKLRAEDALHMAEKAANYIARAVEVSASPTAGEASMDADRIQQAAIAAAVEAMRGGN